MENKTPYEILIGKRPSAKHLRIYDSKVFVRVPEVKRKSKWDDKSQIGTLVGYTRNSYRVLINGKVINTRHVKVIEDDKNLICLERLDDANRVNVKLDFRGENDNDDNSEFSNDDYDEGNESIRNVNTNDDDDVFVIDEVMNNEPKTPNRSNSSSEKSLSTRQKNPVQRYRDPVTHHIYVNFVDANVPSNYNEAMNSSESREWQKAIDSEVESLTKNETRTFVDKPVDKKIIDVKCVYKRKSNDTYKARLVVRGFQQDEFIDNVYSPVGRMETLKILLIYSCSHNLFIEQMDVETAFLNGTLKSEMYIKEPQGYETSHNKLCRLKKALYGLSESPRAWYKCLNKCMEQLNFERSKYEYCLYIKRDKKDTIYILVFVDDLLICCGDLNKINDIKSKLMSKFVMKDLGLVKNYIGIKIEYNRKKGLMTLSQEKYIESLLSKYKL